MKNTAKFINKLRKNKPQFEVDFGSLEEEQNDNNNNNQVDNEPTTTTNNVTGNAAAPEV